MATLNGKTGVWRTVGGRKIFIANGQSLKDAMRESGKFKNLKDDEKPQELKPLATYLEEHGINRDDLSKEEYDKYLKEYRRTGEIESLKKDDVDAKTIQMKGGDKTKYKVLDEAIDSMGEKIYKVSENGQEKWVQGDLFETVGKGAIKEKYGLKDERNELYTKDFLDGKMDRSEFKDLMSRGGESEATINKVVSIQRVEDLNKRLGSKGNVELDMKSNLASDKVDNGYWDLRQMNESIFGSKAVGSDITTSSKIDASGTHMEIKQGGKTLFTYDNPQGIDGGRKGASVKVTTGFEINDETGSIFRKLYDRVYF